MFHLGRIVLILCLLHVDVILGALDGHDPERLFNPNWNAIFAGGMIRIKSVYSDCWLDIRKNFFPGKYEDGRNCGNLPIAGCTPVFPEKLNPNKNVEVMTLDDWIDYEMDGPFFEVLLPGIEESILHPGFEDTYYFNNNSIIQEDTSLFQVSSNDDDTFTKAEADWKIIVVDDGDNSIWKPRQQFQEVAGYPSSKMTVQDYSKTLWMVDRIRMRFDHEVAFADEKKFYRYFGEGDEIRDNEENKIIANSYEDIITLHKKELELLTELQQNFDVNNINEILQEYKTNIELIQQTDPNHPVDIFNLLKRMSIVWKSIQQTTKDVNIKALLENKLNKYFQDWNRAKKMVGSAILNIQLYNDLDPRDVMNGIIKYGDITYISKTKLNVEDIKLIANEAKLNKKLDAYVNWLKLSPELEDDYKLAVVEHDMALENWEDTISSGISTLTYPINSNATPKANDFRKHFKREMDSNCDNPYVLKSCTQNFKFHKIQQLCSDPNHSSPPKPENLCFSNHFKDAYLKLGPFKLEHLNTEPVIQVIHDVIYPDEKELLLKEFRRRKVINKLTSFPEDEETQAYKQLAAQDAHFTERDKLWLIKLGRRWELATSVNMFNPNYRFTAENYQVVNYGIGGLAEPHVDEYPLPFQPDVGGGKIFSTIAYMSDNIVGGKTIFAEVGVAVAAEEGAMAFFVQKENYTLLLIIESFETAESVMCDDMIIFLKSKDERKSMKGNH